MGHLLAVILALTVLVELEIMVQSVETGLLGVAAQLMASVVTLRLIVEMAANLVLA
jgi:hypothetical protein